MRYFLGKLTTLLLLFNFLIPNTMAFTDAEVNAGESVTMN